MSDKKRYIAGYEVINSIHIGDKEIVLGMNLNDRDGHYYMLTDCERNELFERYTNSVVSNSFIELAESFLCRLNEQIEKVKIAEKDMPKGFITADMCDTSSSQNYEGKIIVIKAELLRPEVRRRHIRLCGVRVATVQGMKQEDTQYFVKTVLRTKALALKDMMFSEY